MWSSPIGAPLFAINARLKWIISAAKTPAAIQARVVIPPSEHEQPVQRHLSTTGIPAHFVPPGILACHFNGKHNDGVSIIPCNRVKASWVLVWDAMYPNTLAPIYIDSRRIRLSGRASRAEEED